MRNIYLFIFVILVSGCDSSTTDTNYDLVYIDNGAIQCESSGKSAEQTAQVMIDKGIEVISSKCGYLSDLAVAAQCGLGDTHIYLYEINHQHLQDAQELGFESVLTLASKDSAGYVVVNCRK